MDAAASLRRGLAELGLQACGAQIETLLAWLRLLEKWNRAYNLTAVRKLPDMIPRLVLNSAAAVPHLRGREILDVGSGAGIPGIVLAVLAPERRYTLLDSNGKKTRFLEHCRMSLPLDNVTVVHRRAETFAPATGFDTIISRAFAALAGFTEATRHLGRPGALWLALKGRVPAAEFQEIEHNQAKYDIKCSSRPLQIPDTSRPATLVSIEIGP